MQTNQIICGRSEDVLPTLPTGFFNCSISSPPFWALRDYDVEGQLGLEPTFEEYIDKLCTIYDEVKRVLRADGTCWVNIADTYGGGTGQPNAPKLNPAQVDEHKSASKVKEYLPAKSLVGIPEMFVLEMQRRGWIRRNTLIWYKPNPMPSSAKDRFTVDFEYVYFFTKSKKYWFETQYEPHKLNEESFKRATYGRYPLSQKAKCLNRTGQPDWIHKPENDYGSALGRNKRCVWTIPTQPFPEAHFATYPEKLVEPMIKAGCPEFICTKCGKAREKVYDIAGQTSRQRLEIKGSSEYSQAQPKNQQGLDYAGGHTNNIREQTFKGYTDCGCNAGWRNGVVLDMFSGAMTTALVAYKNRRDYVMIELKPEYIEMGEKRLAAEKEKFGLFE